MASVVTSLGTGSGLPLDTLLTNLMQAESVPLTNLQVKEAGVQSKISALGSLSSSLSSLRDTVLALTSAKFTSAAATTSDKDVATVTADNKAAKGSMSVEVVKLAQQEKAVSAPLASTATVGTGVLNFTFGSVVNGVFTADEEFPAGSVNITSADNTLTGMRDAINKAAVGVTASVVNDGSGSRLVLSSTDTGAAKSFQVSGVSDGSSASMALSSFNYDPTTAGSYSSSASTSAMTRLQAAGDAQVKVDGLSITQASNTVTDAVAGLTLTLGKIGTTKITVTQDPASARTALQGLVTSYNSLISTAKSLSLNTPSTTTGSASTTNGPLAGDSIVRDVTSKLRNEIFSPVAGATGQYTSLASLGVSFQDDGTLKLDATIFDKAVAADPNGVANLFADEPFGEGTQGLSARFAATIDSMSNSDTGTIKTRVDGLGLTTKTLQSQQTALSLQLTQIEARYRKQFTALDTLVTSMNSTATFLTQQLESLANLNG